MEGFKRGDIILKSEPFAYALNDTERGLYCDYCFKSNQALNEIDPRANPDLKRCSNCKLQYFCNRECQMKAWKGFHKIECPKLKSKPLTITCLLLARLFFKLKQNSTKHNWEIIDSTKRNFESLVSHSDDILKDPKKIKQLEFAKTVIQNFAPEFFTESEFISNMQLFEEIFCKMTVNSFEIGSWEMQPIGAGLYFGASVFDHSCDPDAFVTFDGKSCFVRSLKNIPHREINKITISYIDPLDCIETRQKFLYEQYYFTCTCELCISLKFEDSKLSILNVASAEESNIISLSNDLFSNIKNLASLNSTEKEKTLKTCDELRKIQKTVLGDFNTLRIRVSLLGFDLSVYLHNWDQALDYGQEAFKSLQYYRNDAIDVGILAFKLGKILALKEYLLESFEKLSYAKDTLFILLGDNHPLTEQVSSLLTSIEMEIIMNGNENSLPKLPSIEN